MHTKILYRAALLASMLVAAPTFGFEAPVPGPPLRGTVRPELVGPWCPAAPVQARAGCVWLLANGTYVYGAGGAEGTEGQDGPDGDAGRWLANATSVTAYSAGGRVTTYCLTRANDARSGELRLCLDGQCLSTRAQRPRR